VATKFSIERHDTTVLQFPPRSPRCAVHISAARGRQPLGRTRPLMLRESDLAWLVETAEKLEGRAP
jgi:hypothetical protein